MVYLVLLMLAANSCFGQVHSTDATLEKVFELYSWDAQGQWNYALLPTTDRMKTMTEIRNARRKVVGTVALEGLIEDLPTHAKIVWFSGLVGNDGAPLPGTAELKRPPKNVIDKVKAFAAARGKTVVAPE